MPGILGKVLWITLATAALTWAQAAPSTQPTTRPAGMVWVPGGEFEMGALPTDTHARPDESPRHRVKVDGFWMDATEVTNAQFAEFVKATGYVTTAEKPVDWEEMKKTVPEGTPKPPDEALKPGGLCFHCAEVATPRDPGQWWNWTHGADWKHPGGPGSNIEGKENVPVVLVSWDDCVAYCKWAGKRLPTEAEWEHAARAGDDATLYPWGNEDPEQGKPKANTWQGKFPAEDTGWDGFKGIAPVKSYAPNSLGLYDLAGNVWEWTADNYRTDTYAKDKLASSVTVNPKGPPDSYDPDEPTIPKRTMRGGSFLCHESYCSSYRISARMKSSPDTGLSHTGFRCVKDGEGK